MRLREEPIFFLPTYKLKSQKFYDGSRIPSWCDRVLYWAPQTGKTKSKSASTVTGAFQPLLYYAVDDASVQELVSDHRPVVLTGVLNARIRRAHGGQMLANPNGRTYSSPLITIL